MNEYIGYIITALVSILCLLVGRLISVGKDNSAQIAKVHVQGVENTINVNTVLNGSVKQSENMSHMLGLINSNSERIVKIETRLEKAA